VRAYLAVAWKELHELRWLWYAGVSVMVVLPLLQETFAAIHRPFATGLVEQVTLSLGAALAIFVASSTACRDLRDAVEHFWRSRPMTLRAWVSVKLLCGWGVVISIAALGIAAQWLVVWAVTPRGLPGFGWALNALLVHGSTVTAVYALSFAIGSAVGRAVPAAFLSLLAALGLYFLPLIVPALAMLDPFTALGNQPTRNDWNDWALPASDTRLVRTLVMATLTIAGVAAASLVLWKQARLRLSVRSIAWGVCGVVLLMLTVAAEQVGSNLEPAYVYDLPGGGTVRTMQLADGRGYALVQPKHASKPTWVGHDELRNPALRLLEIAPGQAPRFGTGRIMGDFRGPALHIRRQITWTAQQPTLLRVVTPRWEGTSSWVGRRTFAIDTLQLDADGVRTVESEPLRIEGKDGFDPSWPHLRITGDRLYVFFNHFADSRSSGAKTDPVMIEYDISDPLVVRRVRQFDVTIGRSMMAQGILPALHGEGLDPAVARGFAEQLSNRGGLDLDDRHFVYVTSEVGRQPRNLSVDVFRYTATEPMLTFERVGHRAPTPLERLVTGAAVDAVTHNGFLYVLVHEPQHGMVAFDLRDPTRPRKVGHFAAPGAKLYAITATTDGRIVLGGTKLYVFEALR